MILDLSEKQIETAQQLFIATSFRDVVKADFMKMEQVIIDEGTYYIDEIYYSQQFNKIRENYPHDRIITQPSQSVFLAGLRYTGTEKFKNTDADRYYRLLNDRARQKGYIFGERALCEAENDVMLLQIQLIKETQNIHGVQPHQIVLLEDKNKLLGVLFDIFAPALQDPSMEHKIDQFFSMRLLTTS